MSVSNKNLMVSSMSDLRENPPSATLGSTGPPNAPRQGMSGKSCPLGSVGFL